MPGRGRDSNSLQEGRRGKLQEVGQAQAGTQGARPLEPNGAGEGGRPQSRLLPTWARLTTLVRTQVLLQTGDPGAGGWPAAGLQVWQKLQRLEGGRGCRESELRVRTGPRTKRVDLRPAAPPGRTTRPPPFGHAGAVPWREAEVLGPCSAVILGSGARGLSCLPSSWNYEHWGLR